MNEHNSPAVPSTLKTRDASLDVFKGIAILNIAFIHTVWWSGVWYIPGTFLRNLSLACDVPLFFFLSGWGACLTKTTPVKIFVRLLRLYINYLIMVLFFFMCVRLFYQRTMGWEELKSWISLFKIRSRGEFQVVNGSLWFLPYFFTIYLFTPVFRLVACNIKIAFGLLLALLVYVALYTFLPATTYNATLIPGVYLSATLFYTLFYLGGILSLNFHLNGRDFLGLLLCLSLLFGAYLHSLGFQVDMQRHKFPPTFFYLVMSLFSIVFVLHLKSYAQTITRHARSNWIIKLFNYCGKNVFFMYMAQGFGSSAIFILVQRCIQAKWPWPTTLGLAFAVNLIVTLLTARILQQLSDSIFGFFNYVLRKNNPKRQS